MVQKIQSSKTSVLRRFTGRKDMKSRERGMVVDLGSGASGGCELGGFSGVSAGVELRTTDVVDAALHCSL